MTRSYLRPNDDGTSFVRCPCCLRALTLFADVLEPVPLRDQPCTVADIRTQVGLMRARLCLAFEPFRVWRGSECNWLCNMPSHVTPCELSLLRWFDCPDWKNMVRRDCCGHIPPPGPLARCVQED